LLNVRKSPPLKAFNALAVLPSLNYADIRAS
jgi:hypothetical protein